MKLKIYNTTTSPTTRKGESYIRLSRKAGAVTISKEAANCIGITKGVEVLQDEEKPTDWYIRASDDLNAFQPRLAGSNWIFNAVSLARAIEESLKDIHDFNGQSSIKIPVAKQETDNSGIHALLTKAAS